MLESLQLSAARKKIPRSSWESERANWFMCAINRYCTSWLQHTACYIGPPQVVLWSPLTESGTDTSIRLLWVSADPWCVQLGDRCDISAKYARIGLAWIMDTISFALEWSISGRLVAGSANWINKPAKVSDWIESDQECVQCSLIVLF